MSEQSMGQLAKFLRERVRKDWDAVIAISGEERVGKSILAIQLGKLVDSDFDLVNNVAYIPSEKEIITRYYSLKQYQMLHIDEAIRALYKFQSFDRLQQAITKMYATEGYHNKITTLCIPRFTDLTSSFRKYRVKLHIFVIARGLAVVYQRDDDKDVADPWHTKENLKLKEKLLNRPISERKLEATMEIETKTINYLGHFTFSDLDTETKAQYIKLKEESRLIMDKMEQTRRSQMTEKYREALIGILHDSKTKDKQFSCRKYAGITGLSFKQISNLTKGQEDDV